MTVPSALYPVLPCGAAARGGSAGRTWPWLTLVFLLGCAWLGSEARAHEPYLRLTEQADGSVLAEAGFSDNADVAGLKLLVRDRATGATLAEHRLPAGGTMTLKPPAVPYRVVFEGGDGHRVSKVGPEPVSARPPPSEPVADRVATPASPETRAVASEAASPAPAPVTAVAKRNDAGGAELGGIDGAGGDTLRLVLVVGIVFLFGAVAFALGFGAGRRSR